MDRPASWREAWVDLTAVPPFRIGPITIEPLAREARYGDQRERLQPQPMKVLTLLASRRGQVVTREEIVDSCWAGRFVGEDVINRAISLLRAFAARAGHFAIETVPKAGYRLVETDAAPEPEVAQSSKRGRRLLWAGTGALVAALLVLVALTHRKPFRQANPPVPSIAVLPLAPAAADPASLRLAQVSRDALVHMLSKTGFPVREVDSAPQGAPPPADFLIGGDIRQTPTRLIATLHVDQASSGMIVFSRRLDEPLARLDSFPEEIGAVIAGTLSWGGALMVLDRREGLNPAITTELLRQLSATVEDDNILGAYHTSERIAREASQSGIAQLSLAMNTAFVLDDLPPAQRPSALAVARAAADRALDLAPDFGDTAIPWCLLHSSVYYAACERHLRAGMQSDPDAPFTSVFLASHLNNVGRSHDAPDMARGALSTDAYKPAKLARLVCYLEATGDQEEADRIYAQALRWWPHYDGLARSHLFGLIERGDLGAVEAAILDDPDLKPADKVQRDSLFGALRGGDREAARRACAVVGNHPMLAATCMTQLARLGAANDAFAIARKLYPPRVGGSAADIEKRWIARPAEMPVAFLTAPSAAALRRDPRFLALADGLGLIAYWRSVQGPDFCLDQGEPVCAAIRPRRA